MDKTIKRVIASSSNGLGKPWDPVWFPYYDAINGNSPIALYKVGIRSKYPAKESLGLSWNSGRDLLDRTIFSRWNNNATTRGKPINVTIQFLINGTHKDIIFFVNIFKIKSRLSIPNPRSRRPN